MHFCVYVTFYFLHTYSFVSNNISRLQALVNTVEDVIEKFIYFYRVVSLNTICA